jgi:hypothetical protein
MKYDGSIFGSIERYKRKPAAPVEPRMLHPQPSLQLWLEHCMRGLVVFGDTHGHSTLTGQ